MKADNNRSDIDGELGEVLEESIATHYEIGGRPIMLVRGGPGTHIFAMLVDPQPAGMPPGLVIIELPSNCYVDPLLEQP